MAGKSGLMPGMNVLSYQFYSRKHTDCTRCHPSCSRAQRARERWFTGECGLRQACSATYHLSPHIWYVWCLLSLPSGSPCPTIHSINWHQVRRPSCMDGRQFTVIPLLYTGRPIQGGSQKSVESACGSLLKLVCSEQVGYLRSSWVCSFLKSV
jgi:hypothetical protein